MQHYNCPGLPRGEAKRQRAPGRREVGHGALAERALIPVLPSVEDFPYAIRCVSETLESNGSTSQASVCASCLSLMAAGVPIKSMVAGISCGLVTGDTDNDYVLLTDIQGLEDFFGDMDFKVAGTHKGITAIQMDIKIHGLTREIVEGAIDRCLKARLHIMDNVMSPVISEPRKEISKYAPKIMNININPDKIGDVIGKGGKTINEIIAKYDVKIDIEDDGFVSVSGVDIDNIRNCIEYIENLTRDVEVGAIFEGTVVRVAQFGAFVTLTPNKDGMIHISKLRDERVEKVEDVVKVGDKVKVKVIDIDAQGKVALTMRQKDLGV